jgi:UDP-glucuronate 4-epimerase
MIVVNNKVIISGSAGFIGFHLAKKLINMGFDVIGVDSLNDAYDVRLKNLRLSQLNNNKNYEFHELNLSELFRALQLCT